MGAHAVNRWGGGHDVQINTCDRGNGVDQTALFSNIEHAASSSGSDGVVAGGGDGGGGGE